MEFDTRHDLDHNVYINGEKIPREKAIEITLALLESFDIRTQEIDEKIMEIMGW